MSYLWTFFVCLFVLMFALKYTTDLFQSLKTATYLHLLQESLKELWSRFIPILGQLFMALLHAREQT